MQSNVDVSTSTTQWKDQEIKARDADAEDYFDYCRRSLGPYGDRGRAVEGHRHRAARVR